MLTDQQLHELLDVLNEHRRAINDEIRSLPRGNPDRASLFLGRAVVDGYILIVNRDGDQMAADDAYTIGAFLDGSISHGEYVNDGKSIGLALQLRKLKRMRDDLQQHYESRREIEGV